MAVSGQKRKAIGEPCTLRLETSGSNAATVFAELQASQKRRRSDQDALAGAREQHHSMQAQCFPMAPQNMMCYSVDSALHHSSSRTEGSSLSGYGTAFDVGGSPQISTATASHRGWPADYAPAGSFVSSDSHQQSSAGDQHEVAMQAETPHSQAQGGLSDFSFQPPGLQRSNSEPNMRLMLASPLATMPQQMFPQPFAAFGSSSTAGALVPYKAQEEVIEEAYLSTQRRQLQRVLSQMQATQAASDRAEEEPNADAACNLGPLKQGEDPMEVDKPL